MSLKSTLIEAFEARIELEIAPKSRLSYLRDRPVEEYYDALIDTVYVYTRPRKNGGAPTFSEIICGVGNSVRSALSLKRDTDVSAKTGAFFLWTFEDMGILTLVLTRGRSGHAQYFVNLANDKPLQQLWEGVARRGSMLLPELQPWPDWTTSSLGHLKLVKTNDKDVLGALNARDHPIVFEVVNRAQQVGWTVRKELTRIADWALKEKAEVFSGIWQAKSKESRTSKTREAHTILMMAKKLVGKTFYHRYYLDFRGRKYPATPYLHEQGCDLARALIQRQRGKVLTAAGFEWLQIILATQWGGTSDRPDGAKTDKIPIHERRAWSEKHENELLEYAAYPRTSRGWMKADEPWQFLASCMELLRIRMLQGSDPNDFSMITHHEGYLDGSNNGAQHLAALTRDEITAPHVNLVPQDLPGDLYAYIGSYVWDSLQHLRSEYTEKEVEDCKGIINTLTEMKATYDRADKGTRAELYPEQRKFRRANSQLIEKAAVVYWSEFTSSKERRALVKRNVMTLPYGSTRYGMGQQQIDDAPKHGFESLRYLENKWGAFLGRLVYDECRVRMARPMRLLGVFEAAGKAAEANGKFLSWTVPITNFPVVQHYVEGAVKKTWVQYGPPEGKRKSTGHFSNTFQLNITYPEFPVASKSKQGSGASPNCIHSFDAAHLMLTAQACPFDITTIHDSFGALLCDMPALFRIVREQFVRFHKSQPLENVLLQMGGDINNVSFGDLDITSILDSQYAFI